MNGYSPINEHQPMMWLRGRAIFATHFLVAVFIGTMLATTVLRFLQASTLLSWLAFNSSGVLRGEVWRVLTYGLVNPPSLGFAIDLLMIVWFGREVEKFFGRRIFLLLFGCLYLVPPLLFTVAGPWWPVQFSGLQGSLALFVAFAALFPGAMLFFEIQAKWMAIVLVGLYSLMAVSDRDWPNLARLAGTTGFAFAFVRYQQGRITLPDVRFWQRRPKLRVLPDLEPVEKSRPRALPDPSMAEMDALLDKIARSGLASLTAKERARLNAARAELLRKKQ